MENKYKISEIVIKNGIDESLFKKKICKICTKKEMENYRMRAHMLAKLRYKKNCRVLFFYEEIKAI